MTKFKLFLKSLLPTMKWLAAITSTTVDDQFVALLEAWLASGAKESLHAFASRWAPPAVRAKKTRR